MLTPEQETELAKAREQGEHELVEAIMNSPIAMAELANVRRRLRRRLALPLLRADAADLPTDEDDPLDPPLGPRRPRESRDDDAADWAREQDAEDPTGERATGQFLSALNQLEQLRSRREASPPEPRQGEADGPVFQTLSAHPLSLKVLDRLLSRLDAIGRNDKKKANCGNGDRTAALAASKTAGRIRHARRQIQNARTELVRANMRLVVWIARKRLDQGLPLVDMVQEGNLGLIRAAEKFDYRKGVRFSTYAGFWIRQSINRALSDRSRTIRLPVHLLEAKHKLTQCRQQFAQEHGRQPTTEEAADRVHIPVDTVREILRAPKEPLSMEAPTNTEGDAKLGDIVSDTSAPSPLEAISLARLQSHVRRILPTLTPREQQILRMRFGLDSPEEVTLQQIGVAFDLSRERIRQIEARALSKLRLQAEEEELDSYLSS